MNNELKQRVLLICGSSQTVVNFRLGLVRTLQARNIDVSVVALDDEYENEIVSSNVNFYSANSQNRSINPFGINRLKNYYIKIIKQIQPDIVFTFMLKPNIFGVSAAKKAGVKKIFSMVEGAGDVFINNGLKWKIIRSVVCRMYRKSFKYTDKVFFLNNDDKAEFIERKLVNEAKCEIIPGIGVDTERFAYKPIKNNKTFLMIARMLKTKGVIEYCEAARKVKRLYPDTVFNYLGSEGNIKVSDIQEYIDDGSIDYLGTTKDVRPYLEECSVFVLPSYREGFPVSIMEAMSVGRCVITSDTNGCRDAVDNSKTGYLLPIRDVNELVKRMIRFIENPQEINTMGISARAVAEVRFDQNNVNDHIVECILS